ncbi:MAG TPA: hypothetical protein PLY93_06785, partial [Turneriella sp.]|nr:hypothetical protein [Turneriella sp.]
MQQCRFVLLIEYTDDEELIDGIGQIEKILPTYDYASRPLRYTNGKNGGFKWVAFKEVKPVAVFSKFAAQVFKLSLKLHALHLAPAYVSLTNVVSAFPHTVPAAILGDRDY